MSSFVNLFSPARDRSPNPRRLAASWVDLHEVLFGGDGVPPKRWEAKVASFLWARGYSPLSIKLALEHAATHGSFEMSRELSFWRLDQEACEQMLPGASDAEWRRSGDSYWTIVGDKS